MIRQSLFLSVFVGLLSSMGSVSADVFEPFDYPVQSDGAGFNDGFGITYRTTTTGNYGGTGDLFVSTFAEGQSASAAIIFDVPNANSYGRYFANTGTGFGANQEVFLGVVDFPGFGDTTPGGPFASFFSTPQDLSNAFGSVEIRQFASDGIGGMGRFLAIDQNDNEVTTNWFGLTFGVFNTQNFETGDFVNGNIANFDPTQVVGIGIDFMGMSNSSGDTGTFIFDLDNLQLSAVPEPHSAFVIGVAMIAGAVSRRKRRMLNG